MKNGISTDSQDEWRNEVLKERIKLKSQGTTVTISWLQGHCPLLNFILAAMGLTSYWS